MSLLFFFNSFLFLLAYYPTIFGSRYTYVTLLFFCVRTCVIFFISFFMHIHKHIHTRTYFLHIIFVPFFSFVLSFFSFYLTFLISLFFFSSYIFSLLPYYMLIMLSVSDVTFIVIFATHLSLRF